MKGLDSLEVYCDASGNPVKIMVHSYLLTVQNILDHWCDTGCWWQGESEKHFYRISCQDNSLREIFQDLKSENWFLYKTYD